MRASVRGEYPDWHEIIQIGSGNTRLPNLPLCACLSPLCDLVYLRNYILSVLMPCMYFSSSSSPLSLLVNLKYSNALT